MKKLKLKIANNVDTSRIFSASLRGGVRCVGGCMICETHSNDVVPCIKTLINFTVICEMKENTMNEEKKTKVAMMLDDEKWSRMHEQSRRVYDTDGIAPTMHTNGGGNLEPKIKEVEMLGWSRDDKGNVVNWHPVEVANTVTVAKRSGTQNYVKENRFRIRKLTPRECFRFMDVSDEDIDKMQAAGISKSQQYKLAGNSIVVAVLEGIFEKLFIDTDITEPTLF